jgi:hypothetical protein
MGPIATANRNGAQHRIYCWAGVVLTGTPQLFVIGKQVPSRRRNVDVPVLSNLAFGR